MSVLLPRIPPMPLVIGLRLRLAQAGVPLMVSLVFQTARVAIALHQAKGNKLMELNTLLTKSRAKWVETGENKYFQLYWLLRGIVRTHDPVAQLKVVLDASENKSELEATAQEFGYLL